MADFDIAYNTTLENEGGYSNRLNDAGKETYKGISRRYHPSWSGWVLIDAQKLKPNFPKNLKDIEEEIKPKVRTFYKANFWDKFLGDEISNQYVANELFDTGVNMGIDDAVKFLQQALNILNRNQLSYPDIIVDGCLGQNTLNTLSRYLSMDKVEYLYKIINILQGNHYIEYMNKSPIQEENARGWLNRVEFIKK